jgi:two-component system response regulator NreC
MAQRLVIGYLNHLDASDKPENVLSNREKEILKLLVDGFTNKEIAEQLVISPSTVHSHRSNIMTKLGLSTRRELIQYARNQGLLHDS